jgi:adenylosuccinate synthase
MTALVIVGAQWGDEGKGKIVDLLAAQADVVVRYGGGANAGHTLVVGDEKVVFHLVPSGALHAKTRCLLGAGMVIDPAVLVEELAVIRERGLLSEGRVIVSDAAHLVLPQHKLVDALRERGPRAIGTTQRGIGPCYEDRAARRGVRALDLADRASLQAKVEANLEGWRPVIEALGGDTPNAGPIVEGLLAAAAVLAPLVGDVTSALHGARAAGQRILLEGAQGTMLDLDHGTFPFVTSSSVTAGGACTGTGLGPTHIDRVLGITKAYTTRVGEGPFPTELFGEEGDRLRAAGGEYGATTGRPRRCGWLDIPVLRHAVRVNGLSELALTKLDVLSGVDPLRVCVAYELDGRRLEVPPSSGLERVRPLYEELPGFRGELGGVRSMSELPEDARRYVARIEELAGVPITIVSLGPERTQTITLADPWREGR